MASLFTPPALTGARSAMRNNEPNVSLRSGIAPLQRRAFVGSRRAARPVRAAAGPNGTPNTWAPSSNRRSYSPNGGNLGNVRDLYEGATGLDVLAMQKDLVAEGFLGRQHATGYVTSEIFSQSLHNHRARVSRLSSPRPRVSARARVPAHRRRKPA